MGEINYLRDSDTGVTYDLMPKDGGITEAKLSDELQEKLQELELGIGSPLVASTAAEMTDTEKIYVYTGSETGYTSGNWYYYNGSAWTSGGVYNSMALETDKTLQVSGAAADAKVVGDEVTQLKEDLSDRGLFSCGVNDKSIYNGKWSTSSGYVATLFDVTGISDLVIKASNKICYYTFVASFDTTLGSNVAFATGYSGMVTLSVGGITTIAVPADAVALFILNYDGSVTRTPEYIKSGEYDLLKTVPNNMVTLGQSILAYIDNPVSLEKEELSSGTYTYDFKFEAGKRYYYKVVSNASTTVNIRTRQIASGSNVELIATGETVPLSGVFSCTTTAKVLYIYATGAFELSVVCIDQPYYQQKLYETGVVISKTSDGDFFTLRKGIEFATLFPNMKVFVSDGIYDLTNEFATEISDSLTTQYGICLKNGVSITFASCVKVNAIYTGSDTNVTRYFAPFYSDENDGGGFSIDGLNLSAQSTRYGIHDELNGKTVKAVHKILNSRIFVDNTTTTLRDFPQCIGGGVGKSTYVFISGCYFENGYSKTHTDSPLVSYHNTAYSDSSDNLIIVQNSYFADNGTFAVYSHGPSTVKSRAIINNCSLGKTPYERFAVGTDTIVNFELLSYLNEVREQL